VREVTGILCGMNRLLAVLLGAALPCMAMAAAEKPAGPTYPATPKGEVVDDYHGTKVADPYRWLEDLDAPQTQSWVEAQNHVTFDYLATVPGRDGIRERLTRLWDFEKYEIPFKEGGRYFYARNNGVQNQSVLYTLTKLDGEPAKLLDPNTFSKDGTVALSGLQASRDGKFLAYGVSRSGSDWQEWKVRAVPGGKDLPDLLKWIKFSSVSWLPDGSGFFYCRYEEPKGAPHLSDVNYFQKLYLHRLGSAQEEDALVYERKDQKEWGFEPVVTEDGKYLVINVTKGTDPKTACFYKELGKPGAPVVELLNAFDAAYQFVGNDGAQFYFATDRDAPRQRIVAVDLAHPAAASWKELVPQARDTLIKASLVHDRFVISYLADAQSKVKLFDISGKFVSEVPLPGIGTVDGFPAKRGDRETFFSFTGFFTPVEIWHLDVDSGQAHLFRRPKLGFDPAEFETKQVWVTSKDGTKVPMFVSGKKGFQPEPRPTLLYGYGGFNLTMSPAFYVENLVWMQLGGLYAVPCIRGGGEYGEDWHQGGIGARKQNGFDDFLAAAEWLIANKYTTSAQLGIHGRSNGGLLVGAAMTQRPDLFACALPGVGVMDMLRYHKFTIGWAWSSDYGTADTPAGFATLVKYSPLHNVRPNTRYPATLITTGDHDDRVVPAHSYKFAAALQAAHTGETPTLIRIDTKAGHGAGKPTSKRIEEATDRLAFLAHSVQLAVDAGAR
jgi:prolyl oligopeptidase